MDHVTNYMPTDNLPTVDVQDVELISEKEQFVPGSVSYSVKRFRKLSGWEVEDTGVLAYNFAGKKSAENNLELRFCLNGSMYCNQEESACEKCKFNPAKLCREKIESVDVVSLSFPPGFLQQFSLGNGKGQTLSERVLQFTHADSFTRILPLCGKTRTTIDALLNHSFTGTLENIFLNAQMQVLLLYSLDCMLEQKQEPVFACKFLANEDGRDRIIKAREVLLQHICDPITIRELSKKVAINECYLKKGFKEIFGTTIFDFYQGQRMEHAKYLLYEKGLSVTDVSAMLGYSSISHFSTAFKRHTGIKPCELLLR
ncbi:MAG: AraC family transcriptional regulator [Chitinophagaceae bacterium]|nr:MAG: AraC family transcriptional regulator [Chitinophagaceae bacterium]